MTFNITQINLSVSDSDYIISTINISKIILTNFRIGIIIIFLTSIVRTILSKKTRKLCDNIILEHLPERVNTNASLSKLKIYKNILGLCDAITFFVSLSMLIYVFVIMRGV